MLFVLALLILRESLGLIYSTVQRREKLRAVKWDSETIEEAVRNGFAGDSRLLKELGIKTWSNPVADVKSASEAGELLESAGNFFEDPRFLIYEESESKFKWIASGTWPVAWRPRVRVYGTSKFKSEGHIEDDWDLMPFSIFFRDVWPRLEDIYDLYVAPVVEKSTFTILKQKIGGFFDNYKVVQSAPILIKRISLIDETNSRAQRLASALPDFAFSADYKQRGTARFDATQIYISVRPLEKDAITQKVRRQINWEIPIPSRFHTIAQLPKLETTNLNSTFVEQNWASEPKVEYSFIHKPRAFLQAPFSGDVQDPEADVLRRKLITAASDAGLPTIQADPPAIVAPNGAKAIFDTLGHLVLAAYFSRRPKFLFSGSLAIELHPSVLVGGVDNGNGKNNHHHHDSDDR
uniref:Uncharacterized protein n=1 Tax=Aureoumbra lagunensis TaxID=44058 RepID=A0A7S3JZA3_9STRA|mmetsp:Transcript_23473/g.30495  ORF Transcript_23473/g.30495 Transcript_23473/m.30495 type:complete len:407 (+) Transcript_23473:47-1267(+)